MVFCIFASVHVRPRGRLWPGCPLSLLLVTLWLTCGKEASPCGGHALEALSDDVALV